MKAQHVWGKTQGFVVGAHLSAGVLELTSLWLWYYIEFGDTFYSYSERKLLLQFLDRVTFVRLNSTKIKGGLSPRVEYS